MDSQSLGAIIGMASAEAAVSEEWKEQAQAAIKTIALSSTLFTTDEVWDLLKSRGVPSPDQPRAMGPMMVKAAKAGIIKKTGANRMSRQQAHLTRHAREVAVWKSLVLMEN